jgi:hypothetical protein
VNANKQLHIKNVIFIEALYNNLIKNSIKKYNKVYKNEKAEINKESKQAHS